MAAKQREPEIKEVDFDDAEHGAEVAQDLEESDAL